MSLVELIESAVLTRSMSWWRYAVSRVRRPEDADDVVQDAVYRTLRANPSLETDEEASRYIWTVLRKTSVNVAEESRQRSIKPVDENTVPPSGQAFSRSPLEILLDAEAADEQARTFELALSALGSLPETKREAIQLHVLREPPLLLREIAAIQRVAISTVHDRIEKGLQEVEEALRRSENGR